VPAKAGVSVPVPKPAPALANSSPVPVPPPAAKPAPSASADTGRITPAVTPEIQPVGTFVKKQFLWPGDDPVVTGDTPG
jgi:hypothetical protein